LLARISWKIHEQPDSLLARVLLGKYCHDQQFLKVSVSSACSHGWRSILAGREVLKKGLGWIVGDGESISVWRDPWLSTSIQQKPIRPPTATNYSLKVSALLSPVTNDWNSGALRHHLPHLEPTIRRLIPSSRKRKDMLVWLPEKSGSYSTKTGYILSKVNSTALDPGVFNWQLNIWNLSIPPKIKMFLWKLQRQALPVGGNLAVRGILTDLVCKRCGEDESELHILLLCPFAKRVWELAPLFRIPGGAGIDSTATLLTSSRHSLCLPPAGISHTSLTHWIFWFLWKSRNGLVFENRSSTETDTLTKAVGAALEWQSARLFCSAPKSKPAILPRVEEQFRHLPRTEVPFTTLPCTEAVSVPVTHVEDVLCFVDAAWKASSGSCGMGWLFKSHAQRVLHRGSSSRLYTPSALVAEALALKSALIEALRMELTSITVFSNSQVLISLLTTETTTNELQGILFDITFLRRSFLSVSFRFIPRLANLSAD